MNKSEAGKLGRLAVNSKYSIETRLQWSKKGATVLNSLLTRSSRSAGGLNQALSAKSRGALNAAKVKPLSGLEESMKTVLIQVPGIKFESHAVLTSKLRDFEVDFVGYVNEVLKVVIEVTSQKSGVKAESTAYKILKLKQSFPNVFFIAIVPRKMQLAGLKALKCECNEVVFSEHLTKLLEILKRFSLFPIPQVVDKPRKYTTTFDSLNEKKLAKTFTT